MGHFFLFLSIKNAPESGRGWSSADDRGDGEVAPWCSWSPLSFLRRSAYPEAKIRAKRRRELYHPARYIPTYSATIQCYNAYKSSGKELDNVKKWCYIKEKGGL